MEGINIREYQVPNQQNPQGNPIKYYSDTNQPAPEGAQLVREIPPVSKAGGQGAVDPLDAIRQGVIDRIGFDPDTYDPYSETQREIEMGLGQKMMLHTFGRELTPNQMTEKQQLLFKKNMAQLKTDLLKKHTQRAVQGKAAMKSTIDFYQQQQKEATERFSAEVKAAAKIGKDQGRKETDILAGIKYLKNEYATSDFMGNIRYLHQGGQQAYNLASNKYLELLKTNPNIGTTEAARQAHNFVQDTEKKYWESLKKYPNDQKNIGEMFKRKYGYVPQMQKNTNE